MNYFRLIVFIAIVLASCHSPGSDENVKQAKSPMKSIDKVIEEHSAEFLAIPGVVGLAQSELEDHSPCIWIMVREETEELRSKLPKEIDGYPAVIHLSGDVKPMQRQY